MIRLDIIPPWLHVSLGLKTTPCRFPPQLLLECNKTNFKEFRPQFARHKESIMGCIIGDTVEHINRLSPLLRQHSPVVSDDLNWLLQAGELER